MSLVPNPHDPRLAATQDVRERRERLLWLVCACAVVLAMFGLARTTPVGASDPEFQSWYADEENRAWFHFQEWYGASERNAAFFHIRQHFGTGRLGDQAVRVAQCESGLNPRAKSSTNDHGVFQINAPSWRSRFAAVTGEAWSPNVYHADANARFARWLVEETGGWSHWACRGAA